MRSIHEQSTKAISAGLQAQRVDYRERPADRIVNGCKVAIKEEKAAKDEQDALAETGPPQASNVRRWVAASCHCHAAGL